MMGLRTLTTVCQIIGGNIHFPDLYLKNFYNFKTIGLASRFDDHFDNIQQSIHQQPDVPEVISETTDSGLDHADSASTGILLKCLFVILIKDFI